MYLEGAHVARRTLHIVFFASFPGNENHSQQGFEISATGAILPDFVESCEVVAYLAPSRLKQ